MGRSDMAPRDVVSEFSARNLHKWWWKKESARRACEDCSSGHPCPRHKNAAIVSSRC